MKTDLAARVAELQSVVAKMTPGEVAYRPGEHDDWGLVRFIKPTLTLAALGFKHGIPFASASTAKYGEDELNEHRRLSTDPAENDARGIAYLKNHSPALVADLMAEVERLREELRKVVLWGESASMHLTGEQRGNLNWRDINSARAALAGKDGGS